jgi:hypothetical protein
MQINDLEKLYYIVPIHPNLKSIYSMGILSHNKAKNIQHESIAMEEIQDRRIKKCVPQGLFLHEYVNLYINARNKMLFKCKDQHTELCVILVDKEVLKLPDVVIADRNASTDMVRFYPSPQGLNYIDKDRVFAKYWTHPDNRTEQALHGAQICAEVLVPFKVDPRYILGVCVSGEEARNSVVSLNLNLDIEVVPDLFFQ